MPQILVSPGEQRVFASRLRQLADRLRDQQKSIEAARRELAAVWKDRRYAEFERKYREMMAEIDTFLKAAREYERYLLRKAELGERYLGKR